MTKAHRPPLQIPAHEPVPPPPDFEERAVSIGAELSAAQRALLGDFLGRLLAMNELVNLVSRVDPANAWDRHILDSLTLVAELGELTAGSTLIDVGSGGGLPGIPIAIARPDLNVTLLDATEKKVRFTADVAEAMGLTNVTTICGRAERLGRDALHGRFDALTARAVSALVGLVPLTAPFVKPGGRLLLIKGQKAEQELAAAEAELARSECTLVGVRPTPTGRIVVLKKHEHAERVGR